MLTRFVVVLGIFLIGSVGYSLLFAYWYAYWFNIEVLDRVPYIDLRIPFSERIFRDPRRPGEEASPTLRYTFAALLFFGTLALLFASISYVIVLVRLVISLVTGQGFG